MKRSTHPAPSASESTDRGLEDASAGIGAGTPGKSLFVMLRTVEDSVSLALAMDAHHRWLFALEKQGAIFASGPTFEADGRPAAGMTVFRASDFAEAMRLAKDDPFVVHAAVSFEVKRWQLHEGRLTISIDLSDQRYVFS